MQKVIICLLAFLCTLSLVAQHSLIGSVYDENGEYLPGANVVLKGMDMGASTDSDGFYRFGNLTSGNYTVVVSYLGYKTMVETILVKGQTIKDFMLVQTRVETQTVEVLSTWAGEKTPITYTNVDKETLEKTNLGQDVPILLQWTPSAVVTSDAGAGVGYTGIRIRGSDPTRINVTINGIALNDSESQSVFWVDLPDFIASTDQVQIQRGVGTSTNGAGAFGATINLSTAKVHTDPYATLSGTIGSFGTHKESISFGSGLLKDRFTFDGRLSSINSDGYIDRASSDLESYFLSAAYLGDKSSLRLNLFSGHEVTYQAWNGVPPDLVDDKDTRTFNSAGAEKNGEPHDNEVDDYKQTHYQAMYTRELASATKLNLGLHYTKGQGFFEQYKAGESLSDYGLPNVNVPIMIDDSVFMTTIASETDLIRRRWLDNDYYGLTYGINHQVGQADITLGGAWNIYEGRHFGEVIWARFMSSGETGHLYYDNDAEKTDFNIFVKTEYALSDKWSAYVDLQYRKVDYSFENVEGKKLSDDLGFFNPKLGVFHQLNEHVNLYGSFGVAQREPNRTDYTESSENSRPEHEKLYNTELGSRMSWKKATLGVNLYHMYYEDQLVPTGELNDVGAYVRSNVDESYRLGLELDGRWNFYKGLSLTGNATVSQNKVKSFNEFYDVYNEDFDWIGQVEVLREDTDLALSPSLIGALGLNWDALPGIDRHSLEFNLLGKYVGEQYIDNSSDEGNKLEAYFYSDFRVNYTWQAGFIEEIGINLMINNWTNTLYSSSAWSYRYEFDGALTIDQGFFPQATTNYLLGIQLKF